MDLGSFSLAEKRYALYQLFSGFDLHIVKGNYDAHLHLDHTYSFLQNVSAHT